MRIPKSSGLLTATRLETPEGSVIVFQGLDTDGNVDRSIVVMSKEPIKSKSKNGLTIMVLTPTLLRSGFRGIFPTTSFKQYISTEDVDAAYGRELNPESYNWAPKILTLDPSWEGDDETAIGIRQGLMFRILKVIPKNDNDVEIANMLAGFEDEEEADAVFIDGGYGTGVLSVGKALGRNHWQLVWFAGKPNDIGCLNKRAEMWKSIRDWLKEGGSIPKDPILRQELITPETVPRLDGKIQIEAKKDMKARGEASPNRADALAISFAYEVSAKNVKSKKKLVYSAGGSSQGWMG